MTDSANLGRHAALLELISRARQRALAGRYEQSQALLEVAGELAAELATGKTTPTAADNATAAPSAPEPPPVAESEYRVVPAAEAPPPPTATTRPNPYQSFDIGRSQESTLAGAGESTDSLDPVVPPATAEEEYAELGGDAALRQVLIDDWKDRNDALRRQINVAKYCRRKSESQFQEAGFDAKVNELKTQLEPQPTELDVIMASVPIKLGLLKARRAEQAARRRETRPIRKLQVALQEFGRAFNVTEHHIQRVQEAMLETDNETMITLAASYCGLLKSSPLFRVFELGENLVWHAGERDAMASLVREFIGIYQECRDYFADSEVIYDLEKNPFVKIRICRPMGNALELVRDAVILVEQQLQAGLCLQ